MDPKVYKVLQRELKEWKTVRSYFHHNPFNRHQIEGFNKFCFDILPHIVCENSGLTLTSSDKTVRHKIKYFNVTIDRPAIKEADGSVRRLSPFEARARNLTYSCFVFVDVEHIKTKLKRIGTSEEVEEEESVITVKRHVPLCKLPCMVGSDLCTLSDPYYPLNPGDDPFDIGGYYIVNGGEKCLNGQLRSHINMIFVFNSRKNDKYLYVVETRSCHPSKWRSTSTLRMGVVMKKFCVTIFTYLPFVLRGNGFLDIPLALIFVILGVQSTSDMVRLIIHDDKDRELVDLARSIVSHPMSQYTREDAIGWIATYGCRERTQAQRESTVRHIFINEVLPHIGMVDSPQINKAKAAFVGVMANKLLRTFLKRRKADDRDSYANKHIHNTGSLLAVLVRQIIRNNRKLFRNNLVKAINSGKDVEVTDFINYRKLSSSLCYHLATGNWSLQKNVNTGVVMPMSRVCRSASISFQRRINTQCNKDGKATECRDLHETDLGINCINETPEGQSCGIVENLALFTCISMGIPTSAYKDVLLRNVADFETPPRIPCPVEYIPVSANGITIAMVLRTKVAEAVRKVRSLRRQMALPGHMGIFYTENEVHITSEVGRCLRPLFRVEKLHLLPQLLQTLSIVSLWPMLLQEGIVEYLDKAEERSLGHGAVASTPDKLLNAPPGYYSHLELDPVAALGFVSAMQPFPERNQSPRNIYETCMNKQCISLPVYQYQYRFDRHLYVQNYPQKPLVTTQMELVANNSKYPQGMNAIVAIMCYGGQNQEDSILFSQGAVDRGFTRVTYYRTYRDEVSRVGTRDNERFEIPDESVLERKGGADYSKLQVDGIVAVGERVQEGDVLIGKTVWVDEIQDGLRKTTKHDKSIVMKERDVGVVDRVVRAVNKDGNTMVKVRIRFIRTPIVGDKFASRYAQKGTIGAILDDEDLPFCLKDGVTPDIIMNSNAIPSRMTVGQLLECALGKACALAGVRGNATAFRTTTAKEIGQELHKYGFRYDGKQRMRNGMTGELIEAPIFIGPTYYQQLKHFVKEKVHSRSNEGSNRMLTRQPNRGRSKKGGLRFGEMERDSGVCHGAAAFILDRMFYNSDQYIVPVCTNCGMLAIPKTNKVYGESIHKNDWCPACCESKVERTKMPYATKLCMQELYALHIVPRIKIQNAVRPLLVHK